MEWQGLDIISPAKESKSMNAYIVKIVDRILETEAQKPIPKYSIFYSREKADEYRDKIMSPPIKFHAKQIKVFSVEVQILDEVEYS
jgi:hypothetical protein